MATAKTTSNTSNTSNTATKRRKPKVATLSAEGAKALADFNKAKKAEAKAKAAKAAAEAILRAELGNATEATVGGVVAVKVISSVSSHFDRKTLLELYPEAYAATYQETPYTYLKTL